MSTNLYWRPINGGNSLSTSLKFILKDSGYFDREDKFQLTFNDVTYLKGVRSSTENENVKQDCTILIDAIEKNSEIEIYLY